MFKAGGPEVDAREWPRLNKSGRGWWAPEEVRISEGGSAVRWRGPVHLRFAHWDESQTSGETDSAELARRFLGLSRTLPNVPHQSEPIEDAATFATEKADAVVNFVRRYGPLYLCRQHGTPLPHPAGAWYSSKECAPYSPEAGEPLAEWWAWVQRFRALLAAAQSVSDNDSGGEELRTIRRVGGEPDLTALVEEEINLWISTAGVEPRFSWDQAFPSLDAFARFRHPTFLGPLVVQLLQIIGDAGSWRFCDQCHRQYRAAGDGAKRERNRVRRLGRYCGRCRRDPAAKRARDRRYKRRQRASS